MNTLDSVVSNFLMESGYGEADYTRAYHIGLRGLKELIIDTNVQGVYTAKLFVESDGTARLPEDCLKVTRIYKMQGDTPVSLSRNPDLSKLADDYCGCHTCTCEKGVNVRGRIEHTSPFWEGGSLGVGSYKNNGEYYINGDIVYLSPSSCGEDIYVDYKAIPSQGGDFIVHEYLVEAVITYIRWKFHINRKNQDKWDKQYFEKEWHREKRNAIYRLKAPMKQELNQYARKNTKLGLKS